MFLTIPEKFSDRPYLFAACLRERCGAIWNSKDARRISKTKSFEALIAEKAEAFKTLSEEEIAKKFSICFIVRSNSVRSFGDGKRVMIKATNKKKLIHFDDEKFFFLPKSVSAKSLEFEKILHRLNTEKCFKEPLIKRPRLSSDLNELESEFNVNLEIWTRKENGGKSRDYEILFNGDFEHQKDVKFHYDFWREKYFVIKNEKLYFSEYQVCKHREEGCLYSFSSKAKLLIHEKNCLLEPKIDIVQKNFGSYDTLIDKVIERGYLGVCPKNENFLIFDCESILKRETESFGKTVILNTHKLLSIAVNSYQNGSHEQKCFVVKDSSHESQIEICKNFLEFCFEKAKKMKIDPDIERFLDIIDMRLRNFSGKEFDLDELRRLKNFLKEFTFLPIYGFNSQSYDLNVMLETLVQACSNLGVSLTRDNFSILKKGLKYFTVTIGSLKFKDILNFCNPCSLDSYLKTWHPAGLRKNVYPFEKFESVEQIKSQKNFPSVEEFNSYLKGSVDEQVYMECKRIYDSHCALGNNDPNKLNSMLDYLRWYNLSDVHPTAMALINQFTTFEREFHLSPYQSYSLASYSRDCMFKLFKPNSAEFFSFPRKSVATELFRQSLVAGLCNVYKRHCSTVPDDPEIAHRAKYSLSGNS